MTVIDNFNTILLNVKKYSKQEVVVVAVSKTFSLDIINKLIEKGHNHYGENRVKEAIEKWSSYLSRNQNINLHLIGQLQSNKVKDAVKIFSYIHSVDLEKLALKINIEQKKISKNIKCFIQVNFGKEKQKGGIDEHELDEFVSFCKFENDLNVIGLMCIPPINEPADFFFKKLKVLAERNNLRELSMGMSSDYIDALKVGATYVRIGSSIFGV